MLQLQKFSCKKEVEHNVEKWSDASHATRQYNCQSRKLREKNQPWESLLSQKVDYFRKCFSYCLSQNKGEPERLKVTMKAIVPHAFGDNQQGQDHKLNWCKYIRNPVQYRHKDLPNGKDFRAKVKKRS